MGLKLRDLTKLPREPLSREDHLVLRGRYLQRLRGFLSTGAIIIILILLEAGPMTAKLNAAIKDPRLRWGIIAVVVLLATAVFYRRVWIYHRDRKAGFKYVDRMLVISRNELRGDSRFTINLEDLRYHNLEVDREDYERLQSGDRYPVGFAARSGYPLTRAASVGR